MSLRIIRSFRRAFETERMRASERNSSGNRMPDTVYRRQESQRTDEIEIDHKFHARGLSAYRARMCALQVSGNWDITRDGNCAAEEDGRHISISFPDARAYFQ